MSLTFYLSIAAMLFALGILTILRRRNVITILMGVELLLNSANINFVAFNHFLHPGETGGQMVAVFVIILAASEAAVGLAIVLNIFRQLRRINADQLDSLKG
jgi:NADH-quinone oxidoreductase subunit K